MRREWIALALIVVAAAFIWVARARSNGLPDAVGGAGLMILAVVALVLVFPRLRGERRPR